jgi:hypothetical protein
LKAASQLLRKSSTRFQMVGPYEAAAGKLRAGL